MVSLLILETAVQAIGVTNYSLRHLKQLMKTCKIKLRPQQGPTQLHGQSFERAEIGRSQVFEDLHFVSSKSEIENVCRCWWMGVQQVSLL